MVRHYDNVTRSCDFFSITSEVLIIASLDMFVHLFLSFFPFPAFTQVMGGLAIVSTK
jgi:hypothetical protein